MATITYGGADAYDALGGGRLNQETQNWLSQYTQSATQLLSNTAQAFVDQSRQMYQTLSESNAMQLLRNLRFQNDHLWEQNMVEPLTTMEALQTASTEMQRWIMAHPETRRRYHNQALEGWDNTYRDVHGEVYGVDHHDWRQVMSGVAQLKGPEEDFVTQVFWDPLKGDEKRLTVHEKNDVLRSWDFIDNLMEEEAPEDYTSHFGVLL